MLTVGCDRSAVFGALKIWVLSLTFLFGFSSLALADDDSHPSPEKAEEVFSKQSEADISPFTLEALADLQSLRRSYVSELPATALERIDSEYIVALLDFCTSENLMALSQEMLKLFRQDLAYAVPAETAATELVTGEKSLKEFNHLAATLSTLQALTGPSRKEFRNLANPKRGIQPETKHATIRAALEALEFEYENISTEDWHRRLMRAFLAMYEKGKRLELELYDDAREKLLRQYERTGSIVDEDVAADEIMDEVDQSFHDLVRTESPRVQMNIEDWGRAEITQANGIKVIKVIHFESERAFVFVNIDRVEVDSAHVKKIVARAGVYGGRHREDLQTGRDVTLIGYHNNSPLGYGHESVVQNFKRPRFSFTPRGLQWWFAATIHKPDPQVIAEQVVCSVAQLGIIFFMGYLELEVFGNKSNRNWESVREAAFYTFFFSVAVIGPFIDSWIYWEDQTPRANSEAERRKMVKWKKWVKSLLYGIPFTAFITNRSLADINNSLRVLVNTDINSRVKSNTHIFTELAKESGFGSRTVALPVLSSLPRIPYWISVSKDGPKVHWSMKLGDLFHWKWRRIVYNITEVYLNLPFKVAAFMGLSVLLEAHGIQYDMPVGQILFLSLIPISTYEASVISQHFDLPSTPMRQERWENMKGFLVKAMEAVTGSVEDVAMLSGGSAVFRSRLTRRDRAIRIRERLKASLDGTLYLMEAGVQRFGAWAESGAGKIEKQIELNEERESHKLYGQLNHHVLSASARAHQFLGRGSRLELPRARSEADRRISLKPTLTNAEAIGGAPWMAIRGVSIRTAKAVAAFSQACIGAVRTSTPSP